MRTVLLCLLLVIPAGCMRDQAVAAANIRDLSARIPEAGPVEPAQADLLDGIDAEAAGIFRSLGETDAQATTAPMPTPRAAAAEARRHATTIRTPMAQVVSGAGGWLDGLSGSILPMLGGGGLLAAAGWALGRRAASPVLAAALRFGQVAIDRLQAADPQAAAEVRGQQKTEQEVIGVREKVRKAKARAGIVASK